MIIQTEAQKETLLEAGHRLAVILDACAKKVAPGVSAEELDDLAEQLIREGGDEPAFLGYTPEGASRPYPGTLCISVNEEVVHGIPNESKKILQEGDIVGLDLGLIHKGIVVDAAKTVPVGKVRADSLSLMRATEAALFAGIGAAQVGNHVGDISHAIEQVCKKAGFSIVKSLGGHGVGDRVHEEPFVPNYGKPGEGPELVEGMVLALEPISSAGKGAVILAPDGYTYRTKDGSRSAHFEHTILIQQAGTVVATQAP